MNAVIYARFSSSSQNEQSIEGQLKYCYEYAKREGIEIIGEYIDRSKSGTSVDKREEFQKMIHDSKKQQFEIVLVYQLDRFARNRYDSATSKAKLKANGVKVQSVRENISDDASGILMESILEGMAEYYSAELSQKIRRGMEINVEKRLVFGSIPLGFKSVDKQFVIDEDKAWIIRKIFDMYLEGHKMTEICDYLNGIGMKTKTGSQFKVTSINKILQNKRYAGYYIYKDIEVEDGIPAIVSKDTFEKVQAQMAKNRKRPSASKAKGEQYLLTTKIFCGHCGGSMRGTGGVGKLGKYYQYYGCINRVDKKNKTCKKKNVQKDFIEELVVQNCYEMLSEENINKIADEVMKLADEEKDTTNYARLEKSLKDLEKQKQNLVNSLKVGNGNESFQKMIFEQFEVIEHQEKEVRKEMLVEENLQNTLTREHILFFLTKLRNGDVRDYKYRQMLVDVFVNKIYLFDDHMKIVFTTQHEKVEFDISLIDEEMSDTKSSEGSDLSPSSPVQSSPPLNPRSFEREIKPLYFCRVVFIYFLIYFYYIDC